MQLNKPESRQCSTTNERGNKLIRIKSVIGLTGLSKSHIYNLSNHGKFPRPVQLVPGGSSVAWVEEEIKDWIDSRVEERNLEVKS